MALARPGGEFLTREPRWNPGRLRLRVDPTSVTPAPMTAANADVDGSRINGSISPRFGLRADGLRGPPSSSGGSSYIYAAQDEVDQFFEQARGGDSRLENGSGSGEGVYENSSR